MCFLNIDTPICPIGNIRPGTFRARMMPARVLLLVFECAVNQWKWYHLGHGVRVCYRTPNIFQSHYIILRN